MVEDDVISERFKMAEFGPLSEECEIESLERAGGQNITGTTPRRMNQAMDEYKLEKTIIDADGNWFNIIFKRPEASFEGRVISQKTVEKTVEKILGLIKENPEITQRELAIKTGRFRYLNSHSYMKDRGY